VSIDRKLFKSPITTGACPAWRCPVCRSGHFIIRKDSLSEVETSASRNARNAPDWYPDMISGRFVAAMQCSNVECKEPGIVVGDSSEEQDFDEETGGSYWYTYYDPKFVSPSPELFPLPHRCPQPVAERTREAFTLYWVDPASCVARLRVAIELLLDELNVRRSKANGKGNRERLSLHARIKDLCAKKPKFKAMEEALLAAKWLGNEGAHDVQIKRDDALDAFDIVHFILEEVVGERTAFVKRIAKEVNKAKGARKTKEARINWPEILADTPGEQNGQET